MMKTWLLSVLLLSSSAFAQNFSGLWVVSGDVDDDSVTPACMLEQKGHILSGTCKLDGNRTAAAQGSVKGKQATWSYTTTYQNTPFKLTLSGIIGEDKLMQGTISIDPSGASGEFTAERQNH
ncbi:hypothetical protein ACPOL_3357 [Acidisarcina polymorpha]|uniref:Uncharacterized protein n=1 Tax=Acidisarcina polymorpha TaxID=2211140 RepID=A0A2Z5G240_9BACT|nr:hypothetical protein [Acidisarcina polymorpha]AXC12646.1 hypothetical protein ACPOL_3357 [Acidisarcina polymorpha]